MRTLCIIREFSNDKHFRMMALDLKKMLISLTFPDIEFWMQNAFYI